MLHLQISHPSNIVLNRVEMVVIGANRVKLCLVIVTTKELEDSQYFAIPHIYTHTYIAKCPEIAFICVLRRFLALSLQLIV